MTIVARVVAVADAASTSESVVVRFSQARARCSLKRNVPKTDACVDDEDYDQGFRNQRQRQEAPPGTRIKKGLIDIAEDHGRLPHEVAGNLAKLAADNYADEYVRDTFVSVSLMLVTEQPFKIPFVAAVVLYANAEKSEMAVDVIDRVGKQLQVALKDGQWREFKLLLRFLACLSQLFEADGIMPILDELFSRAVDMQTASSEDVSCCVHTICRARLTCAGCWY